MLDVTEQLRIYGESVEQKATHGLPLLVLPESQHPRAKGLWLAMSACFVLLVVGVVLQTRRGSEPENVIAAGSDPVFSESTGVVLLFSDGIDGVLALDLDNSVATRRVLEGERAGDQQFRLTLTSDSLVVGWGEIYAAPWTVGRRDLSTRQLSISQRRSLERCGRLTILVGESV